MELLREPPVARLLRCCQHEVEEQWYGGDVRDGYGVDGELRMEVKQ